MARAMPVISISSAEEDEQRHREQDEVAHALVHAPDHDDIGVLVVSAM